MVHTVVLDGQHLQDFLGNNNPQSHDLNASTFWRRWEQIHSRFLNVLDFNITLSGLALSTVFVSYPINVKFVDLVSLIFDYWKSAALGWSQNGSNLCQAFSPVLIGLETFWTYLKTDTLLGWIWTFVMPFSSNSFWGPFDCLS